MLHVFIKRPLTILPSPANSCWNKLSSSNHPQAPTFKMNAFKYLFIMGEGLGMGYIPILLPTLPPPMQHFGFCPYFGSWLEEVQYFHQHCPSLLLAGHVTAVLCTSHTQLHQTVITLAARRGGEGGEGGLCWFGESGVVSFTTSVCHSPVVRL